MSHAEVSYEAAKNGGDACRQVYRRALEARKEMVQEIFDELSEPYRRILYVGCIQTKVMGEFDWKSGRLGQASAYLRCSFYERSDEDPRGYYSDAHLDTLGISIFLALRQWHRKLKTGIQLACIR